MSKTETLKLLDRDSVNWLIRPEQILYAVREAFYLHSAGDGQVFPIVREPLASGGIFGIKSGGIAKQNVLGFKAAGFWPGNRALAGEPHQATIMLIDPESGRPTCLIDGNTITTLRTGAAGALGLELLARRDSKSLCVFGTGVQASVQVDYALRVMPYLKSIQYLTFDSQPNVEFEKKFSERCVIKHSTCSNDAVSASDIVITATPGGQVLFERNAVKAGTHINCVGADTKGKRELPEGMLVDAKLFVDDLAQARAIGETQWLPSKDANELGKLLTGEVKFERTPDDVTIFDMTGLALQDLTVARLLYEQANLREIGHDIHWPW
ncbi:ornithine cyclodeaminase family protein [Pseudomonas sp. S37]|uniref:ornithine cyclodeaminase family protein n=1 Tax=Pseudomonas sp. S37 TaxID=2767449 RepID=UPI001911A127|nr:ornithine cyclodeaminase family protein [Pseudomonas sp. S37]MBK4992221.1 ornithine cyclodeaminase family protein [Pseudomonas sp. S37]